MSNIRLTRGKHERKEYEKLKKREKML